MKNKFAVMFLKNGPYIIKAFWLIGTTWQRL